MQTVYAIQHLPTGKFMPTRMFRSGTRGWSTWIPQDNPPERWKGYDGFDKNPRLFFSKASVQRALTAWLCGVHTFEDNTYTDWEGIPDGGYDIVVNVPPFPRVREEMAIVEFTLTQVE